MLPQAVRGGKVFAALDLCVESCCRVWVDRRDRQPGECVNKAVTCSTLDPSRRRERLSLSDEDNGEDWRFGNIRFSVNWYGDSDDRQLQDHHRRRRYGYGCSRAVPHFHHFQNGSTVLKCRWTTSVKPLAVLRRAGRARGPRRTDRGGLSQNIRLNGLATAQRGSRPCTRARVPSWHV